MANYGTVRSSSRRITPAPQPPSAATTQPGRASRRAGTRSASREAESIASAVKPTRRSARQASVASDSEQEGQATRRTKRKAHKEVVGDLTTVEELDTQIAMEPAVQTPPRPQRVAPPTHVSPGAVSEMSGTTAISSFSMVEAEMLEPRLIQRHLPKLYRIVTEFLEHLVPKDAQIDQDYSRIRELQKPDSVFTQDFRDYEEELKLHLPKFRSEHLQYIRLRAVRRALLGPDRGPNASQSGLDLILYLANLLNFAKQMIRSDRGEKEIWDTLRELDRTQFPQIFLPALTEESIRSPAGESSLLKETFELALELRTQLFILVLEHASSDSDVGPDVYLAEVFEGEGDQSLIRGWSIPGLGGDEEVLPKNLAEHVGVQMGKIRKYFKDDSETLKIDDVVDLDGLGAHFAWEPFILELLQWVRLRHQEIQATIQGLGGIEAILERVKTEVQQPNATDDRADSMPRATPRKSRTSFGRDRRRSSRKFDPHDTTNDAGVLALKARNVNLVAQSRERSPHDIQQVTEPQEAMQAQLHGQDDYQPIFGDDEDQRPTETQEPVVEQESIQEASSREPSASAGPQSTADYIRIVQDAKKLDKENRGGWFARQPNAQGIEWGDPLYESQPSPGPSRKGKEPHRPSPRKRRRPTVEEVSDDDDAFETEHRLAKAPERRQKAPVAKKVRIDPTPPSHQPPARNTDGDYNPEPDDSISDMEAPEMTEEVPPSTYDNVKKIAKTNVRSSSIRKGRKPRTAWTAEAEEALREYVKLFPNAFSAIQKHDASAEGHDLLQDRTQENLKDKARNMAITMIKARSGFMPGFENMVKPSSSKGKELIAAGYTEWLTWG